MGQTLTEHAFEVAWLVYEQENRTSRKNIVLAQDAAPYVSGEIIAETGGLWTRAAAGDTVVGILLLNIDATAADTRGVAIFQIADYKETMVTWGTVTDPEKTALIAELAKVHIHPAPVLEHV